MAIVKTRPRPPILKNRFYPKSDDIYRATDTDGTLRRGEIYECVGWCGFSRNERPGIEERWPLVCYGDGDIGPADPNNLQVIPNT